MLFPYKYINHDITKLQDWIDFLFINVWCNAKVEYSLELLNGCSELKNIAVEEAWKEDPKIKAKDYITGPISVIYDFVSSKDKCNKGTIPVDVVKRRRSRSETESTGMG